MTSPSPGQPQVEGDRGLFTMLAAMMAVCLGFLLLFLLLIPTLGILPGVLVFLVIASLASAACVGAMRRSHRRVQ